MQGRKAILGGRDALTITILTAALSGCLGGEEDETVETGDTTPVEETLSDHTLTGSVGDGPIVGANVRVLASDGTELASLESDGSAGYTVTVRTKGKHYPLTIDARNGIDLVTNLSPDFDLFGAALEPGKKSVANVNPFSTLAYEMAKDMSGGVSKSNLVSAQTFVSEALNSGLSTLVETGPMGTQIDSTNIAEIIKASETLGELIRRVRDLEQMHNRPASGNSVMRAVASDLIDGVMDGRGGPRTEARVAALTVVGGAQVLLESMQNELYVNGQDATSVMTQAMNQVAGGSVSTTFADLTVTAQMLFAARVGLDACLAAAPSTKLQELHDVVDNVQVGQDPESIRLLVPRDYRTTLEQCQTIVAGGDDATVDTVNTVSREAALAAEPVNNPPTISGTPKTSVEAGTSYSFTPTASDPDGDTLTFSISGRPAWASFNSATGTLSGTPGAADVGIYSGIAISVSDGETTDVLDEFSIDVVAANSGTGSVTLNWTPPEENQDGSPLVDLAGYRIYWGTTPGQYSDSLTIDNPGITTTVIDNLAPGTYEFVATSFDSDGVESVHSNTATKTVQ